MARMMQQTEAETEAKITAADSTVIRQEGNAGEGKNAAEKSITAMAAPLVDKNSSSISSKSIKANSSLLLKTQLANSKQPTEEIDVSIVDLVNNTHRFLSVYSGVHPIYICMYVSFSFLI